jgi:hypothetical protein
MKERIRELAEQATGAEEYDGFRYFDKAKFAELIIRECMSVADLPNNASGQWDHLLPSEAIGEHFGVEE